VVITRKKRLNAVLLTSISFLFLFILFQMFRFLLPQTEITLEQ